MGTSRETSRRWPRAKPTPTLGALAGVSERTVRRRLENPAFEPRVEDRRRKLTDESVARLTGLVGKNRDHA